MMTTTPRLHLPYILQSQSQKEVTHNETLNLLDVLIQAVAEDVGLNTPPPNPSIGQCWGVGPSPTGVWEGKANQIAQAIDGGGWLFVSPFKRMKLWIEVKESYHNPNNGL